MGRGRLGVVAVAAAAVLLPRPAPASTWEIDPVHTTAGFAVRHLVVSKVRGHLGRVTGTLHLDEKDRTRSTVEATVDLTGIDTDNEERDRHLRSADYLDTRRYPTLTFRSKKVVAQGADRFVVTGDLTLRGVTREVELVVEGSATPVRDPWGKTRLGGEIRTTLERDAFGIGRQSVVEGGGLVMGNDVEVTIDVELVRTSDEPARTSPRTDQRASSSISSSVSQALRSSAAVCSPSAGAARSPRIS